MPDVDTFGTRLTQAKQATAECRGGCVAVGSLTVMEMEMQMGRTTATVQDDNGDDAWTEMEASMRARNGNNVPRDLELGEEGEGAAQKEGCRRFKGGPRRRRPVFTVFQRYGPAGLGSITARTMSTKRWASSLAAAKTNTRPSPRSPLARRRPKLRHMLVGLVPLQPLNHCPWSMVTGLLVAVLILVYALILHAAAWLHAAVAAGDADHVVCCGAQVQLQLQALGPWRSVRILRYGPSEFYSYSERPQAPRPVRIVVCTCRSLSLQPWQCLVPCCKLGRTSLRAQRPVETARRYEIYQLLVKHCPHSAYPTGCRRRASECIRMRQALVCLS